MTATEKRIAELEKKVAKVEGIIDDLGKAFLIVVDAAAAFIKHYKNGLSRDDDSGNQAAQGD